MLREETRTKNKHWTTSDGLMNPGSYSREREKSNLGTQHPGCSRFHDRSVASGRKVTQLVRYKRCHECHELLEYTPGLAIISQSISQFQGPAALEYVRLAQNWYLTLSFQCIVAKLLIETTKISPHCSSLVICIV